MKNSPRVKKCLTFYRDGKSLRDQAVLAAGGGMAMAGVLNVGVACCCGCVWLDAGLTAATCADLTPQRAEPSGLLVVELVTVGAEAAFVAGTGADVDVAVDAGVVGWLMFAVVVVAAGAPAHPIFLALGIVVFADDDDDDEVMVDDGFVTLEMFESD